MPTILHRLSIDATPQRVHELVATKEGVQRWWTGRPVAGDDAVGGRIQVHFSDPDQPAATFSVAERNPQRVVCHCRAESLIAALERYLTQVSGEPGVPLCGQVGS